MHVVYPIFIDRGICLANLIKRVHSDLINICRSKIVRGKIFLEENSTELQQNMNAVIFNLSDNIVTLHPVIKILEKEAKKYYEEGAKVRNPSSCFRI